ncbi:MAG TPA: AAA family ATPase [Steroidobacteraceae bacterium]|nr:AAA family ATPase [Steroidobacteraceae bacterium]
MSLFEQTIALLKNRQAQATAVDAGSRTSRPAARSHDIDPLDEAGSAQRHSVDTAALRAAGYLPEPGVERQFAEQYRRIKRPLIDKALSSAAVSNLRIIVVTSALPGDGKTFTSINLALSMAVERDISVLLIDADVAKQHVSRIFGLDAQPGLLDVLADEKLELRSVVVPTTTRGFSILPVGSRIPNSTELLSSSRMREVMAKLCARNPQRILLLDSPPLLVTNEGRDLVKIAGQVVLVVRAEQTPRHAVQAAIGQFEMQQAGGVVLNQVPGDSTDGYYGYGYGSYGTDGAQT